MGLFDKIKNLFSGKESNENPELLTEDIIEDAESHNYVTLSAVQVGKKHSKKELPCWDCVRTVEDEKLCIAILASGDKGGAARGERGAQLACAAAEEAIRTFGSHTDLTDMDERKRYESFLLLAKEILVAWKQAVAADLAEDPCESGEPAYDAEIICALCTPEYFLVLQNGQNSCVILDEASVPISVFSCVRQKEKKNEGLLSSKNAMMNFQFYYSDVLPMAVWLYSNSLGRIYSKSEDLYASCTRLSLTAAENGMKSCRSAMEELLQSVSENKTSNDISAAAILSMKLLEKNRAELSNLLEYHTLWSKAEETKRQLALVARQLKEKQIVLKNTSERARHNRLELEEKDSGLWNIPGLELSDTEMAALQEGLKTYEDKIATVNHEMELLRTERMQLEVQLEEFTVQMAQLKENTEVKEETK